jgi:hypothetical protein
MHGGLLFSLCSGQPDSVYLRLSRFDVLEGSALPEWPNYSRGYAPTLRLAGTARNDTLRLLVRLSLTAHQRAKPL